MSKQRVTLSINQDLYSRVKGLADTEDRTVRSVAERLLGEGVTAAEHDSAMADEARLGDYLHAFFNNGDNITIAGSEDDMESGRVCSVDREDLDLLIYKLQQLKSDIRKGIFAPLSEKEAA